MSKGMLLLPDNDLNSSPQKEHFHLAGGMPIISSLGSLGVDRFLMEVYSA
jgi:hypothetical protein